MLAAEIVYLGNNFEISFNEDDICKDIFNKVLVKINKLFNEVYFLYGGNIIDINEKLSNVMNRVDKERKRIVILLQDNDFDAKKILEHNNPLCNICTTPCQKKNDEYKMCLNCPNGHIKNNVTIKEYIESQKIESSKIVCDECKVKNRGNCNEFYYCIRCDINICETCKIKHRKKHKRSHRRFIVAYDERYSKCLYHLKEFNSVCLNCEKDLCPNCIKRHGCKKPKIKFHNEILPMKERLEEQKSKVIKLLDGFKKSINDIIRRLNEVFSNFDSNLQINSKLLNLYKSKKN